LDTLKKNSDILSNICNIDEKDKAILRILQEDAKVSLRDIEKELTNEGIKEGNKNKYKLSTTAISNRLEKLKKNNIIKKAITLIDCRQLGYREMVLASLRVNSSSPIDDIRDKLENMIEIKYAYIVTGEYPLFIMAKCLDHQDAMSLIDGLRNLPGVEEIKTQIVLDRIKEDPTIIIPK